MARNGDYKYLEQRRLGWYIKVELPPSLRAAFGGKRRIIKSLKTRDLDEARRLRWSALRDIKAEIEAKRKGYVPSAVLDEALRWRSDVEDLRAKGDDVTAEVVQGVISDRAREIDRDNGETAAVGFFGVARGEAEPLQPLADACCQTSCDWRCSAGVVSKSFACSRSRTFATGRC